MDVAELPLLRRKVALLQRKRELERENAIFFFEPHEKQMEFYRHAELQYRYARTGNRFGKSELGACEDIAFALGYRPWFERSFDILNGEGKGVGRHEGHPNHPLVTLGIPNHPTKGVILTTDWGKSEEVFTATSKEENDGQATDVVQGKLFRYIPKASLGETTRNHSGKIDGIYVKHRNGGWSLIQLDTIVSYKQNPLGQESSNFDWIHVDEPIPNGMWKANARGLVDRRGKAWFTCTPLSEPWIDEAFIPNLQDQSTATVPTLVIPETSRFIMTGTMDDNPHNTPEAIADYMSWLTDDEKEARRKGIPLAYSGIVYKEFSWTDHVLKTPPAGWVDALGFPSWSHPPQDYCLRFAIDYHFRKNDAVLFIATSPDEISYVFHELWEQMLLDEEVHRIKEFFGFRSFQPGLVDPLASTPNKLTEITAMDEYRRLGLPVLPATKDPVNGIRAVKANLKARDKHGRPVLFFASTLTRTLFEISRGFMWDDDENKPKKTNDDMMENLYRLCLNGLTYIEPATADDYRIIQPIELPDNVLSLPDFPGLTPSRIPQSHSARYRA